MATKAGYIDVKLPSKCRGIQRKPWRRRWVALQTMANLNEDKTLGKLVFYMHEDDWKARLREKESLFLEDVAHIRRCPSKTHQYAFGVYEAKQVPDIYGKSKSILYLLMPCRHSSPGHQQPLIHLAACSETECQAWMMVIRAIFWPLPAPISMEKMCNKSFRINIIDNSASSTLNLEGAYVLQCGSSSLMLFHPNRGDVAHEWMYSSLSSFFIPPMTQIVDQNRVLAFSVETYGKIHTAPYLFFCEDAKKILSTIKDCIDDISTHFAGNQSDGNHNSIIADDLDQRRFSAEAVLQDSESNADDDVTPDAHRRASLPDIADLQVNRKAFAVNVNDLTDRYRDVNSRTQGELSNTRTGNHALLSVRSSSEDFGYDKLTIRTPVIMTSVNSVATRHLERSVSANYNTFSRALNFDSTTEISEPFKTDGVTYPISELTNRDEESIADIMNHSHNQINATNALDPNQSDFNAKTQVQHNKKEKENVKVDPFHSLYKESSYVIPYRERSKTEPASSQRLGDLIERPTVRRSQSTLATRSSMKRNRRRRDTLNPLTENTLPIPSTTKAKKPGAYKHTRRRAASAACKSHSDSDDDTSQQTLARNRIGKSRSFTDSVIARPRSNSTLGRRNAFRAKTNSLPRVKKVDHRGSDADSDTSDTENSVFVESDDTASSAGHSQGVVPIRKISKENGGYATLSTSTMLPTEVAPKLSPALPPMLRRRSLNDQKIKVVKSLSMTETRPCVLLPRQRPGSCHADFAWRPDITMEVADQVDHVYMELDDIFTTNRWHTNCTPDERVASQDSSDRRMPSLNSNYRVIETLANPDMELFQIVRPLIIPQINIVGDNDGHQSEPLTGSDEYFLVPTEFPVRSSSAPSREAFDNFKANLEVRRRSSPDCDSTRSKERTEVSEKSVLVENRDKHIFYSKSGERTVTYEKRKMSLPISFRGLLRSPKSGLSEKKQNENKRRHSTVVEAQEPLIYRGSCSKVDGVCSGDHKHAGRSTFFNNARPKYVDILYEDVQRPTEIWDSYEKVTEVGETNENFQGASEIDDKICNDNRYLRCSMTTTNARVEEFQNIAPDEEDTIPHNASQRRRQKAMNMFQIRSASAPETSDNRSDSDTPYNKPRGNHGESVSSWNTSLSYTTEEDETEETEEEVISLCPMDSDEESDQSSRNFATLPRTPQPDKSSSVRNLPFYRSLPQMKGTERHLAGDGMYYVTPWGSRRRKNLFDYLGMPTELKNPLDSPPSLPDRPKRLTSRNRESKSRRTRWSALRSLSKISKSKHSEGDSSDCCSLKEDPPKNSIAQVTEWPLQDQSSSNNRRSLILTNDLYDVTQSDPAQGVFSTPPLKRKADTPLLTHQLSTASSRSTHSVSGNDNKVTPPPFTEIIRYSPIGTKLGVGDSDNLKAQNMTSAHDTKDYINHSDCIKLTEKKASDLCLSDILHEHLKCSGPCSHMRHSPVVSGESNDSTPCPTPWRSRSSSQEIDIPIIHCRSLSTSADSAQDLSSSGVYMNLNQLRREEQTADHSPTDQSQTAESSTNKQSGLSEKSQEDIYLSMNEILSLTEQSRGLIISDVNRPDNCDIETPQNPRLCDESTPQTDEPSECDKAAESNSDLYMRMDMALDWLSTSDA